jgi:ATP-dependent Clp protease ATP-binding subunit ClpC
MPFRDMPGRLALYDDRAKRVLALAQDEASRFNHPAIGPEHLLLAVIRAGTGDRPGSGSVGDALNSLGLTLSKAREELEALRGRGNPQHQPDEDRVVSFTPEGDKVIDLAPAEAKSLNAEKVTDRHVLLAVLREPGKAEAMLQSLGLSTEAVRQKVIGSQ